MDHSGTAVRTRNRALDSDKVVLGVHLDNLQILNGDSLASQMAGHLLAGVHSGRIGAGADGTAVAGNRTGTVRFLQSLEGFFTLWAFRSPKPICTAA